MCGLAAGSQSEPPSDKTKSADVAPSAQTSEQEPPEEDTTGERKVEYGFNPLQADKEIKIGRYYLKKGSFPAAQRRFEEALKWDPNSGAALLALGELHARNGDAKASREAYEKFLEVAPDSKEAQSVRRKIAQSAKSK